MTKESEENTYRTYCRDRLVVRKSESKVDADDTIEEKEALEEKE